MPSRRPGRRGRPADGDVGVAQVSAMRRASWLQSRWVSAGRPSRTPVSMLRATSGAMLAAGLAREQRVDLVGVSQVGLRSVGR